ncbi:DEAD/DEAH box helicase [Cytobacillus sp. FSL R7-0680]|uniref:DEAD/DEAH box helicase n=1 Tax=Cytobacillus sp. FSL R7-0680 TaxID=2921689 RepID=UPI0030F691F5
MRILMKDHLLIPVFHHDSASYTITELPNIPHHNHNPTYRFNPQIQTFLFGKQLLLDEISHPVEELFTHVNEGYITLRRPFIKEGRKIKCARCGSSHHLATYPCARCGNEQCHYCRNCLMMGRVSACTPLFSWNGPSPSTLIVDQPLKWDGTLSTGQQQASTAVVAAIDNKKEYLVWAVCGAGKTEVLFAGIAHALKQGQRVCLATPRTDVVLELAPRLKKVFPHTTVAALYGGSEDRHLFANLVISTTHQLFRFYRAFDTVIVDEVDAFPYTMDATLQYAVQQAKKSAAATIYLTATPSRKWQKECRQNKRAYMTIPARFHRFPLPIPQFKWIGQWTIPLKNARLPFVLKKWLQQRIEKEKQVLLFIPKIKLIDDMLPLIQKLHPKVEAVHAEDPLRKEKVQKMRKQETLILLTTTILERGVTFPHIDVAVLGAEERIFTESALVQIAGRVGRSVEAPTGDVVFFHYGKTTAMVRAKKQILQMNKEAKQRGLLHE